METRKEFIKVIAATVLCIGIFTVGFFGISSLVLASAIGTTILIPPTITSDFLLSENTLPEDYQSPELIVAGEDHPDANAISREEAAEIGAQYIWEVFGESIDGKYVRMLTGLGFETREYWLGSVHDEYFTLPFGLHSLVGVEITEDMVNLMREIGNWSAPPERFNFIIDAITGERINISRGMDYYCESDGMTLLRELQQDEEARATVGMFYTTAEPPEDITEYAKAAKEYAQRHFNNTEVVGVVYDSVLPAHGGFGRDSDGNIFIKYRDLTFLVTDSTGREAYVIIHEADGLMHISTRHNDMMPGLS